MSKVNLSDNTIMFDCEVDVLTGRTNETAAKVFRFIYRYHLFKGDEGQAQENFSADNWEAVFQWAKKYDEVDFKSCPVFGHHSKNPFDFFYFCWMRYWYLGFVFLPIIWADVLFGALKPYTYHYGQKKWVRDTSGKRKAYFKMKTSHMKIFLPFTSWILSLSKYYKSWENVFKIYHGTEHRVYRAFIEEQKQHEGSI